jgi:hypothetical protein
MSCIYEIFKDLCIDCIFCNDSECNEDQKEDTIKRNRPTEIRVKIKKKNKGTQTEVNMTINMVNISSINNIKEPGST